MSVQADDNVRVGEPAKILELPRTWLAQLVQHVASGFGRLTTAAALSQTCKSFHALSEDPAITYRNLSLDKPLHSLRHPFFLWLARRQGRVAGLTAELQLLTVDGPELGPEELQLMFSIPGLHIILRCDMVLYKPDDPFMTKVLRPHGRVIDHLISVVQIQENGLKLEDFCEAAAACRSVDFTVQGYPAEPINMSAFHPMAGSLVRLKLRSAPPVTRKLESVISLSLLSQLTSLSLVNFNFGAEQPWIHLAALTDLKQLTLHGAASGDPSLTGLSSL